MDGINAGAEIYLQRIPSPESPELSFWNSTTALDGPILNDCSDVPENVQDFLSDNALQALEFDDNTLGTGSELVDFRFDDQMQDVAYWNKPSLDTIPASTTPYGSRTSATRMKSNDVVGIHTHAGLSRIGQTPGWVLPGWEDTGTFVPLRTESRRRPSTASAPSTVEYAMATRFNNNSISQNLLQIYHDVLEHNLSCWLTGETCPYNRGAQSEKVRNDPYSPLSIPTETAPEIMRQAHQGEKWSNRIYHRVVKLDKMAQSTGLIRLTSAQNQMAQRALHLVIMAFATQWAYNSQRQREAYATGFADSDADGFTEEFDRHIQRSLWQQARNALQDCTDIESYRVVCAELIFGLTQKPWEEDDQPAPDAARSNSRVANAALASITTQVGDIMSKDGPPVFMERAARKMHALKFKFDGYEADLIRSDNNYQCQSTGASNPKSAINPQDRETVGLLYWLAVMFDTISSSMNERPVVVADEDSQHEAVQEVSSQDKAQPAANELKDHNQRWRIDLFIQDNPEHSSRSQLRWPCSYEEAAMMVTRSAPVKVLLYRYVHYLQRMIRTPQKASGRPMEDSIRDALLVYKYWNITYGAFFQDLIEQYTSVPARIRGWFVCIVAHWHLASLMLADLIELIDDNGLGVVASTQSRLSVHTVASIRKSSAGQLSDLARIATPSSQGRSETEHQMPDFHFAVREGTILTEPWTIILIRAFTKAAMLHLQEGSDVEIQIQDDILGHGREMSRNCMRRCEECIRALWFLGKKSDMARNVAVVLAKALNMSGGGDSSQIDLL